MDEVLPQFAEYLASVTLHEPTIPMLSNMTGTWMTEEEAIDPERWARHIRSTVRFADEIRRCSATAPRARGGGARRQPDRIGGAVPTWSQPTARFA